MTVSNDVYNNTGVSAATRCLEVGVWTLPSTLSLSLNLFHRSNETYTDVTVQQYREETRRTASIILSKVQVTALCKSNFFEINQFCGVFRKKLMMHGETRFRLLTC